MLLDMKRGEQMTSRSLRFLLALVLISLCAFELQAQPAPSTQPEPASRAGRGRGRGGAGRGPATTPAMRQDPLTGQWYTPQKATDYAFGADLSFVKQLEDGGKVFKDLDGTAKPALQIFQEHGYNWVRLRTCVEPTSSRLPNTTAYTIAMANDARKRGMKVFLDFHYSNGWADPTNEPTPAQWRDMNIDQMTTALFNYTRDTIAAMASAGALPDMIQVGNEVGNGFLWPTADIREGKNWDNFTRLLKAGINGIDAGRGDNPRPMIMIHVDHGGNIDLTRSFFDKLNSFGVPYDVIGFSFYPWSHGTLMHLRANFAFTAETYHKDVYLVETGYYHTPSQYFRQTPGPFPETPQGQAQWLAAVNEIVMQTPGGRGKGVMWWEAAGGPGLTNRSYFNDAGEAQPVFEVFHPFTRPAHRTDNQ
jgi:arabinogalactan endo-1,4-beta-galactosidase